MTLSDLAVRRPVLAAVASLLVIVFGIAALGRLPVRELPDIDTAIVSIVTTYPGASPAVVDTDITEVIEGAVAGIAGIKSISSDSRRGRSRTTVEFEAGRNIDEAANDVRSAVARVRDELPDDADEPQVIKSDSDADPVMRLAVVSDRMTPAEITDFVDRVVKDRLATLDGVASIEIYGERTFAVRIWLDRQALAARNLTVADVETALRQNNVELPAGELETTARRLELRLDSRLTTLEQFERIVVDRVGGYPVRLRDVADVETGVEDDSTVVRNNGRTAVGLAVLRQAQANTMAISEAIRKEIEALNPTLPEGMIIEVGSDDALFIGASIREVVVALGVSLSLVVLVILIFLRSVRATLIPTITIPVSLIGCFLPIYLLGFSINVLTLLALLLAIGLVVDDAIVVLENIERRIALGESPLVASLLGSRQVTFAVIATTITLCAVFIPISFLEGQAGKLFSEFGFVMAIAVCISTFVALTACPALAANILRRANGAAVATPVKIGWGARAYGTVLKGALHMPLVVIVLCLVAAGASLPIFDQLPRELTPPEDRGVVFVPLVAPQGSTIAYTDAQARHVEAAATPLKEQGLVDTIFVFSGSWGRPHRAFVVLRLAPWGERDASNRSVIADLAPRLSDITGARGFAISPAGLGLRGSRTPLRVVVGGPNHEQVKEWAQALLEQAEQNPGLRNVELDFEENQPQLSLAVDRDRADDLSIDVETIAATLQTMFAAREVTGFVDRGREYPVILQARDEDRRTPSDIDSLFIRAGDGETLVPLGALISVREEAASPSLNRYERLPSITLSAALADGYDLGSAVAFIESAAAETLPPEAQVGFAGQTKTYLETSGGVALTIGLALLIVFLVLAAQFESFVHPLVIMLSVPLALSGAVYALAWGDLSVNLYSQIGILLLIGLMAKNGILIVEFANQLRDRGMAVREAVLEASVLRLRPIIMTVASTILGAVPLVLASGAGAESRVAIGTVIVGGLGLSSILTLFLTPVLYDLFARYTRPRGAVERSLEAELATFTATKA